MKTHVDNVLHLLIKRKYILSEKVLAKLSKIDHNQQHGKKRVGAIGIAITCFFGSTNLYKMLMTHQRFIEDLVLYIYKGYMPLSTCKNIWLERLILHQCPHVVFPSCSSFVK
jgi:hypothetical protein